MYLEIVAKLSGDDQKGIGQFLNFQVPSFSSYKDFAGIVYWLLKLVLFSDKYCIHNCRRDGKIEDEFLTHVRNSE